MQRPRKERTQTNASCESKTPWSSHVRTPSAPRSVSQYPLDALGEVPSRGGCQKWCAPGHRRELEGIIGSGSGSVKREKQGSEELRPSRDTFSALICGRCEARS